MFHKVSRRNPHWFVAITTLLLIAMLVTACGGTTAPATEAPQPTEKPAEPTAKPAEPTAKPAEPTAKPAEPTAVPEPESKYNEAPQFKEMVAAGTLPSVEERLPANPRVIEPLESIGEYGGLMRHPLLGSWSSASTRLWATRICWSGRPIGTA